MFNYVNITIMIFDVSPKAYVSAFSMGYNPQLYMLFAHTANFSIITIKTIFLSIDSTPFFFVWLASTFIWFFLEMTTGVANFFNLKHTNQYRSNTRYLNTLLTLIKLHFNKNKNILIKIIYKSNL